MAPDQEQSVLGYHGTTELIAESILRDGFKPGKEDSWLGSAIYFWEKDHKLAFHWCAQRKYEPPAVIAATIRSAPQLLDLITEDGKNAYNDFIRKFKENHRNRQQLDEWIRENGTQFCDTYFIQLLFKTGAILGVRFAAMANDEALQKVPRTFIYDGKAQQKFRSRFIVNIRIIIGLKDSELILSRYRCNHDAK